MPPRLRVLLLQDRSAADLLIARLQAGGYECAPTRVDDEASFRDALSAEADVVLAEYSLPQYSAPRALAELKAQGLDIPFIVVTGAAHEQQAIECLGHGATDYLLTDRLARLPDAVARAVGDRRAREEARATHKALLESEARFRRLAENAQDIIFRYRLEAPRGFEYVSPAATAVTGYTPDEHYRDPDLALKLAHPEDRWMLEDARAGKTDAPLEMRWIRKDGAIVWTEQRLRVIRDAQGTAVAVEGIARDLTGRKESEQAAQLAAQILERVSSLVLVADRHGDIVYASPSVERLLGFSRQEVLGQGWWQLTRAGAIDGEAERDRIVESLRGGSDIDTRMYERMVLDKHGQPHWFAWEDERGPLDTVVGVGHDITERKRAEEDLETSRRALQTIIDASPFPIIEIDDRMRVKLWNPAAAQLFGWAPEEVIGRENPIVPDEYHADYRAHWRGSPSGARLIRRTRRRRRDGTLVDVLVSVAPIRDAEGHLTSSVGLFADISEQTRTEALLREREEHFRSLIENALDIIAVLDPEGTITYISPSVEAVLGHPERDLLGSRSLDWLHPDDAPVAAKALESVAAGPAVQRLLTVRARHADGSWRSIEMKVKARREQDRLTCLILNARDITDRESLEEQLRQSQKMEAVGRLAGGIAHDFNNLLTAILGYAELMRDRIPGTSEVRGDLAEIINAAERAGALTRQLLAFSRKQVLKPEHLNLNDVITDFQKMLGRVIGEDVHLETRLAPAVGVVNADRGQLEQVLLNLAVNARDAMPRGGTLRIETSVVVLDRRYTDGHARLEPGRWVCLRVTDTGCGMDPEVTARVFEPFFTTKAPGKGTGLGLSTVYGIVAQSGGQIALESAVGTGTSFRLYLPEVSSTAVEDRPPVVPPRPASGTETILLVEDERGIRQLIRKALERHGYRVLEAGSGEQALTLAKQHGGPIDLLVSDIVLPGMSGVDLAQHLVATCPGLKVMHISGFAVAAHAGRLSANVSFIQKPFTIETLTRQVRQCLDRTARGGVAHP